MSGERTPEAKSPEVMLKEHFRLSMYEAKVYLTLLTGPMTVKDISRLSRVPMPRVYDILGSLQEKGFVEGIGGKFLAISLDVALDGRSRQFRTEFENEDANRTNARDLLIKELRKKESRKSAPSQEIHILKGINTITNKFSEIMSRSNDIFLSAKKAMEAKELFKPLLKSDRKREGNRIRILVPKKSGLSADDLQLASVLGLEIRESDTILFDVMVADDQDVIIGVPDPMSDEPYHAIAVMISNRAFASSIKDSMEEIWQKSRPKGT